MLTTNRNPLLRFTIRLMIALSLCLAGALLPVQARAGAPSGQPAAGARATPPASSVLRGSVAPLNPAFLQSLISPLSRPSSSATAGQPLGVRPSPQDMSYTRGMQVPGVRALALPATYDLRTLGRVTSVKDQTPYNTCWSFAACGSLESCLLPGETWDFAEDNMVLACGFDNGGVPYPTGDFRKSTAYLVRWDGPVNESEDAYGDGYTPSDLTARKHVQQVDWIPLRGLALDNDNIKTAVMQYGGVAVAMTWYNTYYNAATASYYYDDGAANNHAVLVVGWDDNYAAANFATAPPGDGAFIVKNSMGTTFGSNGYFYVSYYDSRFGCDNKLSAVFIDAEPTSNYADIYQYDRLGDTTEYGYSSSTGWFANVFSARATASLSAVGLYTESTGTSYEVYTGSSLATTTLSASGTLDYIGFHTVTLSAPVLVINGQPFVVAVKVTSPGTTHPIAVEYPIANYSSGATAEAGQSYVSPDGSSWMDITSQYSNTNVCLKAYVKTFVPPKITITNPTAASSWPSGSSQTISWTVNSAQSSGEFRVWLVTADNTKWYLNKQVLPVSGQTSYALKVTASVPASSYKAAVYWRPTVGSGSWLSTRKSAAFTVTPINITNPTASSSWPSGSSQTISWTTNPAQSSGEFRVWLVTADNLHWYLNKQVLPVSGQTAYSLPVTASVPAGSYKAAVYWRPTVGTGSWVVTTKSAAFTVTPINITNPTASSSWPPGSPQTISWTVNPAYSSGEFRVWLVSADNTKWYINKQVLPVTGKTSYSLAITASVSAGSYKAAVYWRPTVGSGSWVVTTKSAAFPVT
jgi:C1A family cysteine protease